MTHNFSERERREKDEKLDRDAVLSLDESTHSTFKKMPEMKIDAAVLLHILQIDFPFIVINLPHNAINLKCINLRLSRAAVVPAVPSVNSDTFFYYVHHHHRHILMLFEYILEATIKILSILIYTAKAHILETHLTRCIKIFSKNIAMREGCSTSFLILFFWSEEI